MEEKKVVKEANIAVEKVSERVNNKIGRLIRMKERTDFRGVELEDGSLDRREYPEYRFFGDSMSVNLDLGQMDYSLLEKFSVSDETLWSVVSIGTGDQCVDCLIKNFISEGMETAKRAAQNGHVVNYEVGTSEKIEDAIHIDAYSNDVLCDIVESNIDTFKSTFGVDPKYAIAVGGTIYEKIAKNESWVDKEETVLGDGDKLSDYGRIYNVGKYNGIVFDTVESNVGEFGCGIMYFDENPVNKVDLLGFLHKYNGNTEMVIDIVGGADTDIKVMFCRLNIGGVR